MKKTIPFFSLDRQWNTIKDSVTPHILETLESCQFVGGKPVATFEKRFSQYIGSSHAISCNSGTDALWLALKALQIQPRSIVLTTPLSFIASSSEIIAHDAYPVFIDIDESYNISSKKIEDWLKLYATRCNNRTIHKKTGLEIAGIITVDLFGQCADYHAIKSIADAWNLWIIEDACQAVGASIENKKAGTFGDISCFSLYPTKNLGVCGDGGILTTSNPTLAQDLYKLRNHGRASHYEYECYGINSRLDGVQAVVATKKLALIDQLNARRRQIAHTYTTRFSNLPLITTPQETCGTHACGSHVYHQYTIQVANRDMIREHLQACDIGTNVFYPKTLDTIPFLQPPEELRTACPVAHHAADHVLALPIWPELTDKEVSYICDCVEQAVLVCQKGVCHGEKRLSC